MKKLKLREANSLGLSHRLNEFKRMERANPKRKNPESQHGGDGN